MYVLQKLRCISGFGKILILLTKYYRLYVIRKQMKYKKKTPMLEKSNLITED